MSNTRLNRNKKLSFLNGNHISRVPFGYKKIKDGIIVFNDKQIEVVKRIFELRNTTDLGYHSIAKKLKLLDSENNPRKIFIKNILENPFYAGFIRFNDKIVKGNQPIAIAKEDFYKINNIKNIENGM